MRAERFTCKRGNWEENEDVYPADRVSFTVLGALKLARHLLSIAASCPICGRFLLAAIVERMISGRGIQSSLTAGRLF